MNELAVRTCVPCRGGVPPLTDEQIAPLLAQLDGDWRVAERSDTKHGAVKFLTCTYRYANFAESMRAAVRIGAMAEEQNHHPDLHVFWGRLVVEVWTHKIGGLTESDFIFAAKCDALQDTPDLGAVFDEHLRDEFELHDAAATMETMSTRPHLYHVPTMAGGNGRDEIFEFYRDHFVTRWPADTVAMPVSRTTGTDQIVDELVMSFTHDVVIDALLPGVPPSGRKVLLPVVVVVKFDGGKVAHEHIYWDQASLLEQVGRIDPTGLPVTGVEQARNLLDGSYATNVFLKLL